MYYMPAAQRIERIEFVRGGAGLLYGPQVGPVMNLVTRRADAQAAPSFRTDQSGGSNGLYSTYNEVRWAKNDVGIMAAFDHRSADGPRDNEDYDVNSAYLGLSYEGFEGIRLGFDVDLYQSDSGEAGRLNMEEFKTSRNLVKTPFNRVEIDQVIATLTYEQQIGDSATLDGRLWHLGMDRLSRRSAQFTDPANEPSTTAIDEQQFRNYGIDLRAALAWGDGNVFTAGATAYQNDSPRTRHVSENIRSSQQRPEDLLFDLDRAINYSAFFIENLFTLGRLSITPSVRLERINYDLREDLQNPGLARDRIDLDRTDDEILMGLGLLYRVGDTSEVYANVSESYRPQRFDDLINPASELAGSNAPDVSRGVNYELGFRSQPSERLLLDISLFRIDFQDKIEQIQVNISDVERVNSGDSRHQGLEFNIEYQALRNADQTFTLFANGSLLDAEIENSVTASLEGNTPAFAPEYLLRGGFIYEDSQWNAALTATVVDEQFWQDSNGPRGTGARTIEAEIPAYEVLDFSLEYRPTQSWTLYGGINNLLDEDYFSRVRNDGIEPALERTVYAGVRFATN
jgi:Fe(3+) dicitrate transport protein